MLIRPLLFAGVGLALPLNAAGICVPSTLFRAYVMLLFGVGIVIWIQGNFLVPDYGGLTGPAIDWASQSWRNPYEVAMWIGVPLLAVTAAR